MANEISIYDQMYNRVPNSGDPYRPAVMKKDTGIRYPTEVGYNNSFATSNYVRPDIAQQVSMDGINFEKSIQNTVPYTPATGAGLAFQQSIAKPSTLTDSLTSTSFNTPLTNQALANVNMSTYGINNDPLAFDLSNSKLDVGSTASKGITPISTSPAFDWKGAGDIALGAANLGLGLAQYEQARLANKDALATSQLNRQLAQDQYNDRLKFREGLAKAFA